MKQATVSVIVPTYRHRDYVLRALESVFAQNFLDFDLIVINDGSPDDTAEVLRPMIEAGRIKYVDQTNAGQSAARNRGAAAATGEFLAFLDDDDAWPADKLMWQVELLRTNPSAVMVWGEAVNLETGKRLFDNSVDGAAWQGEGVIHRCPIRSPGQTLIRRSAFEKVGGFDVGLWGTDDFDLYIRLAEIGPFVFSPQVALQYRWHDGNASNNGERMQENEQKVRRKHADSVVCRIANISGTVSEGVGSNLHRDHLWLAWFYFLEARYSESRHHYIAGAKAAPRQFIQSGAWRQARAAFLPDRLRPIWRRWKGKNKSHRNDGTLRSPSASAGTF